MEDWKKRDPIATFREWLHESLKVPEGEFARIDEAVAKEIAEAVAFAEQSPDPEPENYIRYIFA